MGYIKIYPGQMLKMVEELGEPQKVSLKWIWRMNMKMKCEKETNLKVKQLLKKYSTAKKIVDIKKGIIEDINNDLSTIKTGWEDGSLQSGGINKEDKLNNLLDKKIMLEKEIGGILDEYKLLIEAVNSLEETQKKIIYNLWIFKKYTVREQASKLYLSKSAVHKRSEQAISKIYNYMQEKGYNFS